jgi:hypothetical protein
VAIKSERCPNRRTEPTKPAAIEFSSKRLTDTLSLGRGQGEGSNQVRMLVRILK